MKRRKHPHIKRVYLYGARDWAWGCYSTRESLRPVIISRSLERLMAATKRAFANPGDPT